VREITLPIAAKVLETVDAGLVSGMGRPVPGQMCVEAAVCFALGLPHGDEPACVSPAIRALKIMLNDSEWSTNAARAKGLRRLALAQLGSKNNFDNYEFARRVSLLTIQVIVPQALRAAASLCSDVAQKENLLGAALACEKEGTQAAANAAESVAAKSAAKWASVAAKSAAKSASVTAEAAEAAANAANAAEAAWAATLAAKSAANAAKAASASFGGTRHPTLVYY